MMLRTVFVLGVTLFLQSGCGGRSPDPAPQPGVSARPEPFLGFPEDRVRKMEDQNPETSLRGIVTMTEVQPTDHATYRRLKEQGKVIGEVRRGGEILFAVEESLHVPVGEEGDGAYVTVTERYKAPLPGGP